MCAIEDNLFFYFILNNIFSDHFKSRKSFSLIRIALALHFIYSTPGHTPLLIAPKHTHQYSCTTVPNLTDLEKQQKS